VSEHELQEKPENFTTKARIIVVCVCAVLGPILTGFFLAGQLAVTNNSLLPRGTVFDAFNLLLFIVLVGVTIGVIPTLLAGLGALWFFRHRPNMPWWVFFTTGMTGIFIIGLVRAVFVPIAFVHAMADMPSALAQLAIPILLSALVCWRFTRRWHSPKPTP
jgi:hypothetical protein